MPKYRITYKVEGYAESSEVIDANSLEEAESIAWEAGEEEACAMVSAKAVLLTDEEEEEA